MSGESLRYGVVSPTSGFKIASVKHAEVNQDTTMVKRQLGRRSSVENDKRDRDGIVPTGLTVAAWEAALSRFIGDE